MMEPKFVGPNSYHAPAIKDNNTKGNGIEHGLCAKSVALLNGPEKIDAKCLKMHVRGLIHH